MSLKLRLAVLTAGIFLSAVAAFAGTLLWSERRALEESLARERTRAAQGLAEVCRGAIVNEQDLLLTNYLKRLAASPDLLEAFCADADGRLLGHTDPTRFGAVQADPAGPDALVADVDVRLKDRVLGRAVVSVSRARVRARIDEGLDEARRRILRIAGALSVLGFVASFLATAWAVRPVRRLVEAVRIVSRGDWSHRIPVAGSDELSRLTSEFNRMAEKLGELDRMKQDFVNAVTHDLKSPLAAVTTAAELVQKETSAPKALENLFLIRQNADRLFNLVTSILEVARIESGLVLDKAPVKLEDVADRVVRSLKPIAQAKGLALEIVVDGDMPTLDADGSKLERAAANLVGNAVKFTDQGSVTVTVDRDGARQRLSVADTGPGIPAELRERLFTKFARGREKKEGSGLGLSIAKGIVEAHGGDISVESGAGGTTFILRLPEA